MLEYTSLFTRIVQGMAPDHNKAITLIYNQPPSPSHIKEQTFNKLLDEDYRITVNSKA